MSESGAKAALNGYRLQTLFILETIFNATDDLIIQPEGKEDLAIYDGEELIQAVQVKARSTPLTISAFDPQKSNSFFHRAVSLATNKNIKITVVSFGEIGNEISSAWSGNIKSQAIIINKLLKYGIKEEQTSGLFKKISFEQVDEKEITDRVFTSINNSLMGGEVDQAYHLLMAWLYFASEDKIKISPVDVITKINSIGKFLSEQSTYHSEWFTTIAPLEEDNSIHDLKKLTEDYYRGSSASYPHILANLDIPRSSKLTKIEDAYTNGATTVILCGASGQGKTSLGLRYLHDYVPSTWQYQIKLIQNRTQALRIAQAISSHLKTLSSPLYLFIDVTPRDLDWGELIKDLAQEPNIKILVTIRSEDFARNQFTESELGFPKTFFLDFTKKEAKEIYSPLANQKSKNMYPTFNDAWRQFGKKGSLLEFVHFITQSTSVKERLDQQVTRLWDDIRQNKLNEQEILLLQVCSVANAYEARLDIVKLAKHLKLVAPARTLSFFENEYLLKRSTDKTYSEPIHPIRSTILSDLLDTPFSSWEEAAKIAIKYIPETDLGAFLLYSFSRKDNEAKSLLHEIKKRNLSTWSDISQICSAMLWYGVKEYFIDNKELITETQKNFGDAWFFILNFNVGKFPFAENPMLPLLKMASNEQQEFFKKIQSKQTNIQHVYSHLKDWLESFTSFPRISHEAEDWKGFAAMIFWANEAKSDKNLWQNITCEDIKWATQNIPLDILASIVGNKQFATETAPLKCSERFTEIALNRYRKNYKIIKIEDERHKIHFIVDQSLLVENVDLEKKDPLHEQTIQRLCLMAMLTPNAQKIGSQGYGHAIPSIQLSYDATHQKGVEEKYLKSDKRSELNSIFLAVENYTKRPDTWVEFSEITIKARLEAIDSLKKTRNALTKHFSKNKPKKTTNLIVDACYKNNEVKSIKLPRLPKSAVDEWGYFSESKENQTPSTSHISKREQYQIVHYKQFLADTNSYFSHINNFISQVPEVFLINLTPTKKEKTNIKRISVANLLDSWKNLASYQKSFRELLDNFISHEKISELEKIEAKLLQQTWALWHEFTYNPNSHWSRADIQTEKKIKHTLARLEKGILKAADKLKENQITLKIIRKNIPWENKQVLWISFEPSSIYQLYNDYIEVIDIISKTIGIFSFDSLEYCVISKFWEKIAFIPVCEGYSINQKAWVLNLHALVPTRDVRADSSFWLYMQTKLDSILLSELEIQYVDNNIFKWNELQESIAHEISILANLTSLDNIPDNLDVIGNNILESFLTQKGNELSDNIVKTINLFSNIKENILNNNVDEIKNNEEILDLVEELELRISFPSNDNYLEFTTMQKWYNDLCEANIGIEWLMHLINIKNLS